MRLKIQTFPRGVGRDQDAERVLLWRRVEGVAQTFPVLFAGEASINPHPFRVGVGIAHDPLDLRLQIAQRVFPFGENQHAAVGPFAVHEAVRKDPFFELMNARVGEVTRALRQLRHAVEQLALAGGQVASRSRCRRRNGFDPQVVVALEFFRSEIGAVVVRVRRGKIQQGGSRRRLGGPLLLHRFAMHPQRSRERFDA